MKILVAVKRVPDWSVPVRLRQDGTGPETAGVKMVINPFDEIAVEEAVRLRQTGEVKEILVVTIGPSACQEVLRAALARGADRAVLIETEADIQPLVAARFLKALAEKEQPDLILMGKQSVDTDNNQTGQMLAGLMDIAQGTFAYKLTVEDGKTVTVTREIDGGLQTLRLSLPAVITTDLRLNEPRYLSLPAIVQAKKKPLEVIPASAFSVDITPHVKTLKMALPEKRRTGVKVSDVSELVKKLREEARVLT